MLTFSQKKYDNTMKNAIDSCNLTSVHTYNVTIQLDTKASANTSITVYYI